MPSTPVREGGLVVGASNGRDTVRLFPGARAALRDLRARLGLWIYTGGGRCLQLQLLNNLR